MSWKLYTIRFISDYIQTIFYILSSMRVIEPIRIGIVVLLVAIES